MTFYEQLTSYLAGAPVYAQLVECLGEWDEEISDADDRFISINFEPSPRPGVIDIRRNVRLVIAGKRNGPDLPGGKVNALADAEALHQYILDNPESSCFANVICLSGIIGPATTTHKRLCYTIALEITT